MSWSVLLLILGMPFAWILFERTTYDGGPWHWWWLLYYPAAVGWAYLLDTGIVK